MDPVNYVSHLPYLKILSHVRHQVAEETRKSTRMDLVLGVELTHSHLQIKNNVKNQLVAEEITFMSLDNVNHVTNMRFQIKIEEELALHQFVALDNSSL